MKKKSRGWYCCKDGNWRFGDKIGDCIFNTIATVSRRKDGSWDCQIKNDFPYNMPSKQIAIDSVNKRIKEQEDECK